MTYKVRLLVQEITPYIFEIEAEDEQSAIDYVKNEAFLDEAESVLMTVCNDIDCCVISEK